MFDFLGLTKSPQNVQAYSSDSQDLQSVVDQNWVASQFWSRTDWILFFWCFSPRLIFQAISFPRCGVEGNKQTKKRQNNKILHIKLYASSNFEYHKTLWLMAAHYPKNMCESVFTWLLVLPLSFWCDSLGHTWKNHVGETWTQFTWEDIKCVSFWKSTCSN